jgi:hypothetical protein
VWKEEEEEEEGKRSGDAMRWVSGRKPHTLLKLPQHRSWYLPSG